MSSSKYDVITFGDTCVDLIMLGRDVTPRFGQVEKLVDDYLLEMGGSCCIFACQAAKLGLRTAVLARVGNDMLGRLMIERMAGCGVDTRYVMTDPMLKTGLGVALAQGNDRAILTYLGSASALTPADVTDEFLAMARHMHYGSFFLHTGLRPGVGDIFRRAKQLGLTISLDTNWDPAEEWNSTLMDVLPLTDVFMPNEQELRYISRRLTIEEGVAWVLDQGVSIVTVKLGERGARVYTRTEVQECQVQPATGGDSVGAGDSFDAGFLAGWLRGLPLARCLEIACACGRGVASRIGGVAGQPTWQEVGGNGG